jgi:hypothetical protein
MQQVMRLKQTAGNSVSRILFRFESVRLHQFRFRVKNLEDSNEEFFSLGKSYHFNEYEGLNAIAREEWLKFFKELKVFEGWHTDDLNRMLPHVKLKKYGFACIFPSQ